MTTCRKHKHSGFQKMGKTCQINQIIKKKGPKVLYQLQYKEPDVTVM